MTYRTYVNEVVYVYGENNWTMIVLKIYLDLCVLLLLGLSFRRLLFHLQPVFKSLASVVSGSFLFDVIYVLFVPGLTLFGTSSFLVWEVGGVGCVKR